MATPVLLVHGARTSRTMWRAQVETLTRLGHDVLAIDLPGHGERLGERFSLDAAAQAVRDGIRTLANADPDGPRSTGGADGGRIVGTGRLRRVVVVGLSLGGYVTLHAVSRDAEHVGAVVAAGCCTSPDSPARSAWALLARGIAALPDAGAGLNQFMVDRTLTPQAARDVAEGGFALGVMGDMLREMQSANPRADLARIDVPVWLVNGRYDHFRAEERAFARAGRDVRLRIVPRAKHLVSLDQPVRFTRIVLEAISSVESGHEVPAT